MYFKLSKGSRGTHGLASTDQSSCQRLNWMAGRLGPVDVVTTPPASSASAGCTNDAARATPNIRTDHLSIGMCRFAPGLVLEIVYFGDIAARKLNDSRIAKRCPIRLRHHGDAMGLGFLKGRAHVFD